MPTYGSSGPIVPEETPSKIACKNGIWDQFTDLSVLSDIETETQLTRFI
jgi:hypothetical protein